MKLSKTSLLVLFVQLPSSHGIFCDLFGCGGDVDVCGTVSSSCAPPAQPTNTDICAAVTADCPPPGSPPDVCATVAADCAPPPQSTNAEICAAVSSTCAPPPQPTNTEICAAVSTTCPVDVCAVVSSTCPPPAPPTLQCQQFSGNRNLFANGGGPLGVGPVYAPCPSGHFMTGCTCNPFLVSNQFTDLRSQLLDNNECICIHSGNAAVPVVMAAICCSIS